ncbi:winged helix-turn-helix transcriptional regulator [Paenibacillus sp. MER 78]|nr:winged helix-turn-helix transcriptional regulator [Paenibacillus sp. MER 78]
MENSNLSEEKGEVVPDLCEVDKTMNVLFGKWKVIILIHLLYGGTQRFNELKRKLPHITQKTLTTQLRELENEGIINRVVYAQVPPKVEYSMTPYGATLQPILEAMHQWGQSHSKERGQQNLTSYSK